jgi:hypothetical protein
MTQKSKTTTTTEPVSTVTKHITIYSDNPIHDCIDRMIGYCEYIEKADANTHFAFKWMQEAASELAALCQDEETGKHNYFDRKIDAKKPD